jgi:hypothetical protein
MSRQRRLEEIEISLSLRLHDCAGPCAYVYAVRVTADGRRAVLDSRHFAGDPVHVLDQAHAFARELELEHFLAICEPF